MFDISMSDFPQSVWSFCSLHAACIFSRCSAVIFDVSASLLLQFTCGGASLAKADRVNPPLTSNSATSTSTVEFFTLDPQFDWKNSYQHSATGRTSRQAQQASLVTANRPDPAVPFSGDDSPSADSLSGSRRILNTRDRFGEARCVQGRASESSAR